MKDRFQIIPAVYLFLKKENQILLSRRFQTGFADGQYSLVSGHLEGDETLREAIMREAKEEANIDVNLDNLEMIHTLHRSSKNNDKERIDIFFQAQKWSGEIQNMEEDKCDDLRWFALDDLPDNIVPYLRQALENILEGKIYSEFGF